MTTEVDTTLRKVYDGFLERMNDVTGIFNDYYGEDRVDLQNVPPFGEFRMSVDRMTLNDLFSDKDEIRRSSLYKELPPEIKSVTDVLLEDDSDSLWHAPILDDDTLVQYILPVTFEKLSKYIQDVFIIIHFPNVRISNEHDRYVDITHLWVKVPIEANGSSKGYFSMNRSEYPMSHIMQDYMHSHVNGIPTDDFSVFKSPCLGRGPIKQTLATLAVGYDEPIWRLFCLELDRYTQTESLTGVPYRKLENLSRDSRNWRDGEKDYMNVVCAQFPGVFDYVDIRAFTKWFLSECRLRYNFINGSYGIAMSYVQFAVYISNMFIKWYNMTATPSSPDRNTLVSFGVLRECRIDGGGIKLYSHSVKGVNPAQYEGRYICTFKRDDVTLHIVDDTNEREDNLSLLLDNTIISHVAVLITRSVNYIYGNNEKYRQSKAGASTGDLQNGDPERRGEQDKTAMQGDS